MMLSAPIYARDAASMVAEISRLKERLDGGAGNCATQRALEARIESLEAELAKV